VLVIGDDSRAALAVIRSLGRAGYDVHVAAECRNSPALRSRYIRTVHALPPYWLGAARWTGGLAAIVQATGADVVFPVTDTSILPLHHHRAEVPAPHLAYVNAAALAVFFDKGKTRTLAESLDIPVAPGAVLSDRDTGDSLAKDYGLPVYIKARHSYRLDSLKRRGQVSRIQSPGGADTLLASMHMRRDFLVEAEVQGNGFGVSVLAVDGDVRLCFGHMRLREGRSGGSAYRMSAPIPDHVMRWVTAMAEATKLTGLAMFEWRLCPSGAATLLEVNARPWGSLPLALAAGVDFPAAYIGALLAAQSDISTDMHKDIPRDISSAGLSLPTYGPARRKALSQDITEVQRGFKGGDGLTENLRRCAGTCLTLLTGHEADSYSPDDPAPFRAERAALLTMAGRKLCRAIPGCRQHRAAADRDTLQAVAAHTPIRRIIFVCRGNQYRSAFAAAWMRRRLYGSAGLTDTHADGIKVKSAGTQAASSAATNIDGEEGGGDNAATPPGAPEKSQAAARALGLDLSRHRQLSLWDIDPAEGDLWVIFDRIIEGEFNAIWPTLPTGSHRLMLGNLQDLRDKDSEIADPVDMDMAQTQHCFQTIETLLDRLVALNPQWRTRT